MVKGVGVKVKEGEDKGVGVRRYMVKGEGVKAVEVEVKEGEDEGV
jgi:hypothetical protein